ncbi:MAG: saccharopine dehydrogenase C-terminal domain-containing protein, partial [Chitinophagaceae bacterium]
MKNILLFGAGKSTTFLIEYLLDHAPKNKWHLTVVDNDLQLIRTKIGKSYFATAESFDIHEEEKRKRVLSHADLVISLLPTQLHSKIAIDCLAFGKNLITASYLDDEIKKLNGEIKKAGLLFLYEAGLDPGIDHMSAMNLIHSIQKKGGTILSYRSFCGGLLAPESFDNPWDYKISWNAKNVVSAGVSGAKYKEKGEIKEVSYEKLFDPKRTTYVEGLGKMAFYPNRDSLPYLDLYGLQEA